MEEYTKTWDSEMKRLGEHLEKKGLIKYNPREGDIRIRDEDNIPIMSVTYSLKSDMFNISLRDGFIFGECKLEALIEDIEDEFGNDRKICIIPPGK
jgi:hypothetical protein